MIWVKAWWVIYFVWDFKNSRSIVDTLGIYSRPKINVKPFQSPHKMGWLMSFSKPYEIQDGRREGAVINKDCGCSTHFSLFPDIFNFRLWISSELERREFSFSSSKNIEIRNAPYDILVETTALLAHTLVRDTHIERAKSGCILVKTRSYNNDAYLLGGLFRQGLW